MDDIQAVTRPFYTKTIITGLQTFQESTNAKIAMICYYCIENRVGNVELIENASESSLPHFTKSGCFNLFIVNNLKGAHKKKKKRI